MLNQVVHMVTTLLYMVKLYDKYDVKVAAQGEKLECCLLIS